MMLYITLITSFTIVLAFVDLSTCGMCSSICKCNKVRSRIPKQGELGIRASCTSQAIMDLKSLDFESLPENLIYLILKENSLSSIEQNSFTQLSSLIKLDLSQNHISHIEDSAFANLTSLEKLDLSSNQISRLSPGIFRDLQSLQRLILSNNAISWMPEGTLSVLPVLRLLDLESNPLICDCRLLWLVRWVKSANVRVAQKSNCYLPAPFRGTPLTRMNRQNMHCNWPLQLPFFELNPRLDQLVFEGDSFLLQCRVSKLDFEPELQWFQDGILVTSDLYDHVIIDFLNSEDRNVVGSSLYIPSLKLEHAGTWTCFVSTPRGNDSRSIHLVVVAQESQYCPAVTTSDNKGEYHWPETLPGITMKLQCTSLPTSELDQAQVFAYYTCSSSGVWEHLNSSDCPYVSEVTKVLEQFALTNLSLSKTNSLDSARGLRNYTRDGSILKDRMDIVFIIETIEKYLRFVPRYREIGEIIIDITNSVMGANQRVLQAAQIEERACSRLVQSLESLSELMTEGTFNRVNKYLAVEEFIVKSEGFQGMTCSSYIKKHEAQDSLLYGRWVGNSVGDKILHCSTGNSTSLPGLFEKNLLDASIRIPGSLFLQEMAVSPSFIRGPSHKLQFIVYRNSFLFPRANQSDNHQDVLSSVIACKIAGAVVSNLTVPIEITLRTPIYTEDITPVWWDSEAEGQGDWSDEGCQIKYVQGNLVTFSCYHLGSFGLLQNVEAALFQYGYLYGFRPCHPTIYIGTIISVTCLLFSVIIYCACFKVIQMPKKNKHSVINTCLALIFLYLTFCAGVRQVYPPRMCQIVGLLLHYLTLSVLLWMLIAASNLYKKLSKTDLSSEPPSDEPPPAHPLPPKPMIRFYLVGWGISCIICGISAAVHLENYGGPHYCFLGFSASIATVYGPAVILILLLVVFYLLIYCVLSNPEEVASDNHPLTDQSMLPKTESEDCSSVRSQRSTNMEDAEHSPYTQLRAQVFVMSLFLLNWLCAAMATGRPLVKYVPADELIFGVFFCLFSIVLGVFVFTFFCYSRQDVYRVLVRWLKLKVPPEEIENHEVLEADDATVVETTTAAPENVAQLSQTCIANSAESLFTAKSNHVSSFQSGKVLSVNLLSSHPSNTDHSLSGAEMFYDPRQVVVAKRFFEKNRRRQQVKLLHKNNLGKDVNLEADCKTKDESDCIPCLTVQKNNNICIYPDSGKHAIDSAGGRTEDSLGSSVVHLTITSPSTFQKISNKRSRPSVHMWSPTKAFDTFMVPESSRNTTCEACLHANNPWMIGNSDFSDHPKPSGLSVLSHSCCSDLTDASASHTVNRFVRKTSPCHAADFPKVGEETPIRKPRGGGHSKYQGSQTLHVNKAFHPPSSARRKRRKHRSSSRSSDRSSVRHDKCSLNCHFPRSQSAYEHMVNDAMDVIESSSEGERRDNPKGNIQI